MAVPVATAGHGTGQLSVSGSYAVGSPLWFITDACDLEPFLGGANNGVDSSCVDLPDGAGDHTYNLTADSGTGVVGLEACFWTSGGGFISCGGTTVPDDAAKASVGSIAGLNVAWTMTIG